MQDGTRVLLGGNMIKQLNTPPTFKQTARAQRETRTRLVAETGQTFEEAYAEAVRAFSEMEGVVPVGSRPTCLFINGGLRVRVKEGKW
jgi:hypothetical protein